MKWVLGLASLVCLLPKHQTPILLGGKIERRAKRVRKELMWASLAAKPQKTTTNGEVESREKCKVVK